MKDIDFDKVEEGEEMIAYKEYTKQMRENSIVVNGILQVNEELWLQIADIIDVLAEKQIPKKPIIADEKLNRVVRCPHCHHKLGEDRPWVRDYLHCYKCGQALDWEQEDDR